MAVGEWLSDDDTELIDIDRGGPASQISKHPVRVYVPLCKFNLEGRIEPSAFQILEQF